MPTDLLSGYDEVFLPAQQVGKALGLNMAWEDTDRAKVHTGPETVYVDQRTTDRGQASLGERGNRMFCQTGIVTIRVFAEWKNGHGPARAREIAKAFLDAYEGERTPNVTFRNVKPQEVGRNGNYYQVNVLAIYEWDEIK